MDPGSPFYVFATLLGLAGVFALLAHWLKQPLIVAFIGAGIVAGPSGLEWVAIGKEIDLLAIATRFTLRRD